MKQAKFFIKYKLTKSIMQLIILSLYCVSTVVGASVSLDRTIKEKGDELASVSVMLEGNEGRLLVLNKESAVLTEYKGKAGTRYKLLKKKVFESEDVRGLARLDDGRYLVSKHPLVADAKQVINEL